MEIYKDLNTQANKDFESLLNSQLSKIKIEEGKIIDGLVTKITNKFVFLFVEGLKSEPVLDINELKSLNLIDKVKEGSKVAVLLEKIEDKNGDVIVSATKAQKIKGWYELEKAYEKIGQKKTDEEKLNPERTMLPPAGPLDSNGASI